ncbi:MAG: hypothetical protein JOZ22_05850 [Acidobacteriia bacterium]|nr:hypothetical protein [Terriglobia bacterium]
MAVVQPRSRVVNFRLSSSEYERVYCASQAEGLRTVSEFARSSVLRRIEGEPQGNSNLDVWLTRISEAIARMDRSLAEALKKWTAAVSKTPAQVKSKQDSE